jgi:hypothetical protein
MSEGTRTEGGITSVVEGGTRNKLLATRVGKALNSTETALTRQEVSWVINKTEGRRSGGTATRILGDADDERGWRVRHVGRE